MAAVLFRSDDFFATREAIDTRIREGALDPAEGYRQIRELDPDDASALLALGEDDPALLWRGLEAHPLDSRFPLALYLTLRDAQPELAKGLAAIAWTRSSFSQASWDGFDSMANESGDSLLARLEADEAGEVEKELTADEPDAVRERLEPFRRIDRLCDAAEMCEALTKEQTDEYAADAQLWPLLLGLLTGLAREEDDLATPFAAVAALAITGEMARPEGVPYWIEFVVSDVPEVENAARWALGRFARKAPETAREVLRRAAVDLPFEKRPVLAEALAHLGEGGSLIDMLHDADSLEADLQRRLTDEVAFGLRALGGPAASAALGAHSGPTPAHLLKELRARLRAQPAPKRAAGDMWEGLTVYDFTTVPFTFDDDDPFDEDADDEEFDEDGEMPLTPEELADYMVEPVRRAARPGRNDACWCGSGKKYKKCHLDADEAASRSFT